MLRVALVALAVLVAVIAYLLGRPWLYAGAALPLGALLGLLGWRFWTAYQNDAQMPGSDSEDPEPLESHGIVDVRPQTQAASGEPDEATDGATRRETGNPTPRPKSASTGPEAARAVPDEGDDGSSVTGPHATEAPVLSPLLESLRAALEAETVCLLAQEEVVLEYRIEALTSTRTSTRTDGTFETRNPLLTATMSRQPVTVRSVEADTIDDLGYYEDAPDLRQVAVAPVPRPDDSTTIFLLADATDEANLGTSRARSLLEHYAETVPLLLGTTTAPTTDTDATPPTAGPTGTPRASESPSDQEPDPTPTEEQANGTSPAEDDGPRPRREIIAEEMEAADAAAEDLALILVHLNRAESIARQGESAVHSAERRLSARLRQAAPGQRVERFGELTYGIFVRGGVDDVESWAADLQTAMARETGELEGGVSVGVAVRGSRHDPQALRADATEALREAFETGTCTVVT